MLLTIQKYSSPMSETPEKTLSVTNTSIFFLVISQYLQISFALKYFGVDQVLTKILQIDQKLTFNVFHILNQYRISKIEKISDDTDPPKNGHFLGGSGALKYKDLGYVSGRK